MGKYSKTVDDSQYRHNKVFVMEWSPGQIAIKEFTIALQFSGASLLKPENKTLAIHSQISNF